MASISRILMKVRWSLAQRGPLGTLRQAVGRVAGGGTEKPAVHPFDTLHGVDTSGLIGGGDLATGHAHDMYNTAYYGMAPSRFSGAMERWSASSPRFAVEEFSFVDLGCGKGRALLLASLYPFHAVMGVELNAGLAAVARANVAAWIKAKTSAAPLTVLHRDAATFVFPDGPCLLYLFNPFTVPVLELVIDNIERQFAGRGGELDVIYFNPQDGGLLEKHRGFERLWSGVIPLSAEDAAVDLVASDTDLCSAYRWIGMS